MKHPILTIAGVGAVAVAGFLYWKDRQIGANAPTVSEPDNGNSNDTTLGGTINLLTPNLPFINQATAPLFAAGYVPDLPTSSTGFTAQDFNYGVTPVEPGLELQQANGYAVTANGNGDITVIPGLGSSSRVAA